MQDKANPLADKVVLITGAAHRVGAAVAEFLHGHGASIALHYRASRTPAEELAARLLARRPDSVRLFQADLLDLQALGRLAAGAIAAWGRLDVLVNNASTFYPTPVDEATEDHWNDLLGTNLKAPFFLSRACAPELRRRGGCIVNMVDIHAERPLRGHPVYSIAKAGAVMLTRALAAELGPEVRVNAVAPGAILWPEQGLDEATRRRIVERTFLKRQGSPLDIARAIRFLIADADYMSGQVLTVDGGRSLNS